VGVLLLLFRPLAGTGSRLPRTFLLLDPFPLCLARGVLVRLSSTLVACGRLLVLGRLIRLSGRSFYLLGLDPSFGGPVPECRATFALLLHLPARRLRPLAGRLLDRLCPQAGKLACRLLIAARRLNK